jgi:amino acid adenylation domain-containing protein
MISTLIDKLIDLNINIELVEQDKLKIHADINKIPVDVLSEIRLKKEDLIRYLAERQSSDRFETIPNVAPAESYPLSSTQRRLWLLGQFEDSNAAYNRPRTFVFDRELNVAALEQAFQTLIERHESLRTVFRETVRGEVRQFILPPAESGFGIHTLDLRAGEGRDEKVRELIRQESARPFDLGKGPMLRASLYQVEDSKWVFCYIMHHIISDGWSMGVLINELLLLYNTYAKGGANPLPPLRLQYKDYAAWQQEQLSGEAFQQHRAYWLDHFEGELPVLDLHGGKLRPAMKTYNGGSMTCVIPSALASGIKALCRQQGATLFMGMLAAVEALFCRYTGQYDMIIGTPVAGREHIDLQDQIGFYANTLALRTRFSAEDSYRKLLDNVRQVTLGAYQHQVFPFDTLVNELNVRRDLSRNPLFDIQVIVENGPDSGGSATGEGRGLQKVAVSSYEGAESSASVFDMVLFFVDSAEGLQTNIVYNSDVFSLRSVEQVAAHLEQMLTAIVAHPDEAITRLEFMSAAEEKQLLDEFNASDLQLQTDKNIIDLFREQVKKTPNELAVFHAGQQLSYKELDEQSDRLAYSLVNSYNLKKGELVAVILDRTEKWLVTMLAVLKSGGVYVPIDPAYPTARKEFMLKDASARVLITQTGYIFDLDYYTGDVFAVDVQLDALEAPAQPLQVSLEADDLAYVIFTSGSTGQPKGVMINHGALSASIQSQQSIFRVEEGMRCLQFTSSSFDVSVYETFIALAAGGALYVMEEDHKKDPVLLGKYLESHAIEMMSVPPAYLRLLDTDKLRGLKKLVTGGEAAVYEMVMSFIETGGTYYNAYGPTESSLCTSVFPFNNEMKLQGYSIPIGRPIPGVQVYILDGNNPVPLGVTGELCIGGAGLAKGYLNRTELTADRFVPNPFREGEKMYRTGDLARWMPDGNIEFLGRKDDQVKIRGHRIELGEVEKAVQSHPQVDSAVVLARPDSQGDRQLVAYIVSSQEVSVADMLPYLSKILPVYMLPAHFVQLESFPLTGNGKVDRNKLPDPEGIGMVTGNEYVAPRNEGERRMVQIWEEILGRKDVGVKDDYFELGGSSLKAMVLVKKVLDETGVAVPLKIVFDQKTVESIALYVEENGSTSATLPGIGLSREEAPFYDASFNQKMYFSEWNSQGDHLVINSFEYPELEIDAFRTAMKGLIERHEMLRTVFVQEEGGVKQQVLPAEGLHFPIAGPTDIASVAEIKAIMAGEYARKFDFSQFPLFAVQVLRSAEDGSHTILLTMHHILTDGWSGGILKEELTELYTAAVQGRQHSLKPMPFQYRHYSQWQKSFLASAEGENHRAYWLDRLEGFSHSISWPEPGSNLDQAGKTIGLTTLLRGKQYEEAVRFAQKNGLTLTSLFMGTLALTLHNWTEQQDITICTNVSGRSSKYYGELDPRGVIGFFANLLLVRNFVDGQTDVLQFLRGVQDNFLEDLGHDAYPIDRLVTELPGINAANFLESTVFFNYHNYSYQKAFDYGEEGDKEEVRGGRPLSMTMGLSVTEFKNCAAVQLLFNGDRFSHVQRNVFRQMFYHVLNGVLRDPRSLSGR